jgi:SAM-dependent methyltransferase
VSASPFDTTSPFNGAAADYDRAFTETVVGRWMRAAVWQRCDALFSGGSHVLEINCGTGEDAVHLAGRGVRVTATDAAPAMVAEARAKAARAGVGALVRAEPLAMEAVSPALGTFDGLLSNFGGLNCAADLAAVADRLAGVLRRDAAAVVCVMGPWVPWEWAWFLGHGDTHRAFRRWGRHGVAWRGLTIRYPTVRELRRAFSPAFDVTRVAALGAIMPPPFAEPWVARHPGLAGFCHRVERRVDTCWPLPWLADHVIVELKRTAS